jgi:hypothetical protein
MPQSLDDAVLLKSSISSESAIGSRVHHGNQIIENPVEFTTKQSIYFVVFCLTHHHIFPHPPHCSAEAVEARNAKKAAANSLRLAAALAAANAAMAAAAPKVSCHADTRQP